MSLEIRSEIPPWEPAREAVHATIRDAFRRLSGDWRVTIQCSRVADRWMVRIDGPAFEWYLTLHGDERRDPETVAVRLEAALRNARTDA